MTDAMKTHGLVSWIELKTENTDKARAFYGEVLGWKVNEMEMPGGKYAVLLNGEQPIGGIVPGSGGWRAYVTVDDVDKRLAQAKKMGGKVLSPAVDVPGVGRMALIEDPTGANIHFITYADK